MSLILDNTRLTDFHKCPRRYHYRHNEGLRSLTPNADLEFGKAIHSALEEIYLNDNIERAIEIFKKEYGSTQHTIKTPEKGEKILREYYKKYIPEHFEVLEVEQGILRQINPQLMFYGKLDLVVESMGEIVMYEHKTAKNMGSFIHEPNHQITGYMWLSMADGRKLDGCCVNLLGVLKTKEAFSRPNTHRSEDDYSEWLRMLTWTAEKITECTERDYYPIQSAGCFFCEFKPLCTSGMNVRDKLKKDNYEVEFWEPWLDKPENEEAEIKNG